MDPRIFTKTTIVLAILCVASAALAQDYHVTPLGQSFPMWIEHTASINDDGDVAWTHYNYAADPNDGVATAKAWIDGDDITLSAGDAQDHKPLEQSYATSIASDGTIVGWGATNARLSVREAKLWQANSQTLVDLHAEAPAGYRVSVADRIEKVGNTYYVVGWVRKKTGRDDLPEPYVWFVNGTNVTGQPLTLPSGANSGFARGIAAPDDDGNIWACGSTGAIPGTYMQATCWNVTTDTPTLAPSTALGGGLVSSSTEQVRSVLIDGVKHALLVGFATLDDGETYPMVYDLTDNALYEDLSLVSGGTGIVKDVHSEAWTDAGGATGPNFVGTMATTPPLNLSTDSPLDPIAQMRATYQTRLGGTSSADYLTCRVDDGMSAADTQSVASAVSPNGRYQLAWSSATHTLQKLERKEKSGVDLDVYVRDTEVRTLRGQRKAYASAGGSEPTLVQYFWAETPGTTNNGTILWGDVAGCEAFRDHKASGCDADRTFDLGGANAIAVDFSDVISGMSRTLLAMDAIPSSDFVQVALQGSGNQCHVSSVMTAQSLERHNDFPTQSNESQWDWQNCGLSASVEYDTDVLSSLDHCGSCNFECQTAHNDSVCNAGACEIISCDPGWVDLNGIAHDGCECQDSGDDQPNLTAPFEDTNCDGIDGDIENSIFVDGLSGTDNGSCGTMAAPCKTVQYGVNQASAGKDVLISQGTYTEAVNLKNGVSLYGGYNAADSWSRSEGHVVRLTGALDAGHGWAARGSNLSADTIVNQITFEAPNATGNSTSSIAIACQNCNGLTVAYVTAKAGTGTAGVNGANGSAGANGKNGQDGGSSSSPRPGGAGGQAACVGGSVGGTGGQGGSAAWGSGNAGGSGTGGNGSSNGTGGSGGSCKKTLGICRSSRAGSNAGGTVQNGTVGGNGSPSQRAGFSSFRIITNSGGNGLSGRHGGAGGGGGGGSGNLVSRGGGGGGGGSGGCGGTGGSGGSGGGSSVAMVLRNSINAVINTVVLQTANAGKGGNGGSGGAGGTKGVKGDGRSVGPGNGGDGGDGGNGGRGGHGGGSAGGDSVCILTFGGTVPAGNRPNNTCSNGAAGGAGTSSGNSGPAGQTGMIVNR